jgi:hypothetical protein
MLRSWIPSARRVVRAVRRCTALGAPSHAASHLTTDTPQNVRIGDTTRSVGCVGIGNLCGENSTKLTDAKQGSAIADRTPTCRRPGDAAVSQFRPERRRRRGEKALQDKGIDPGPIDGIIGPRHRRRSGATRRTKSYRRRTLKRSRPARDVPARSSSIPWSMAPKIPVVCSSWVRSMLRLILSASAIASAEK